MTQKPQFNLLYAGLAPVRWIRMAKAAADRNSALLCTAQRRSLQVVTARAPYKRFAQ